MRWRLPVYSLLGIVVLPIALWAAWPWWSVVLLRQALSAYNLQLSHISLQRPRWHELIIEQITLTQSSDILHTTLSAENITLRYQPAALLHAQLDAITIDHLNIVAEQLPAPAPTPEKQTAFALTSPGALIANLPMREASIADLRISASLRSPTAVPIPPQAHGSLDYRQQKLTLQLTAELGGAAQQLLTLSASADKSNQIEFVLKRQLDNQQQETVRLHNRLEKINGPINTDTQTPLLGDLHIDLKALVELAAAFVPAASAQLAALQVDGYLDAQWNGEAPTLIDAQFLQATTLKGTIKTEFKFQTNQLLAATGHFDSDFALTQGLLEGLIKRGEFNTRTPSPAVINKLYGLKSTTTLPLALHCADETRYRIDVDRRGIEIKPANIVLRLRDKQSGIDTSATIHQLAAQYTDTLSAQLHVTVQTPLLPIGTLRLRPAELEATATLSDKIVSGTWQWHDVANIYQLKGDLRYQLDTESGELAAQLLPLTFHETGDYLPKIFSNWNFPLDFSSGELLAQGKLQWDPSSSRGTGDIEARKLGGFYNRNLMNGIAGSVHAGYQNGKIELHSQQLSIASINVGIPINNIHFGIDSTPQAILFNNFSAQLFGGTVAQPQIRYVWNSPDQNLVLNIEHLQLEQILALQQGVEGSGTLDGAVPIRWLDGAPHINDALLQARAPGGILRYRGDVPASATTNPGLALAFTALQNFHYNVMTIRASYSALNDPITNHTDQERADSQQAEPGDMLLRVALQGRNPTADSPPINFNLNIKENIPALLQSLQLGQDISDRIEKRIKAASEKQQRSPKP